MNLLLLGNGFDLYHDLPTKYINFLNTVNFLKNNTLTDIKTIGDVFGNKKLNSVDKEISNSYNIYREIYDKVEIDLNDIDRLINLAENNIWFTYLSKSLEKDITWIDFEKEISAVINVFYELFLDKDPLVVFNQRFKSNENVLIAREFNFYLPQSNNFYRMVRVLDEYTIEYPLGTDNKIIDKDKIVKCLKKELVELADCLKLYLKLFIDKSLEILKKENYVKWQSVFQSVNCAITFNYTKTYEKLYGSDRVIHLHGDLDQNIVLGINPDKFDKFGSIDTTFLPFKKYFQRVIYKTDTKYLSLIKSIKEYKDDVTLFVIGHSLDVTDSDIIEELFSISNEIFILNYDEIDEAKHISNLIDIFGKESFDDLRVNKNMTFIPIDTDITSEIYNSQDMYFPTTLDDLGDR
ncbi:MAG: hypothetical protein IJN56_00765 [Clostridia bacterium]|nr:hypothetical protein [Clostridia bacterium]